MSKLSKRVIEKIQEDILYTLYENNPRAIFANAIAKEIARDNELVLNLLFELKQKGLVTSISKSKTGKSYINRKRWTLTDKAYEAYKTI